MYSSSDTISQALEFVRNNANVIRDPRYADAGAEYWLKVICAQNNIILQLLADIAGTSRINASTAASVQEMATTLYGIDSGIGELIEKIEKR